MQKNHISTAVYNMVLLTAASTMHQTLQPLL